MTVERVTKGVSSLIAKITPRTINSVCIMTAYLGLSPL